MIKYPDNPNTSILNTITTTSNTNNKLKTDTIATVTANSANLNNNNNNKKDTIKTLNNTKAINIGSSQQDTKINNVNSSCLINNNNSDNSKLTGPVNGNECYFWRTTGCVYADKCRYLHINKNKGIDKKPWHKAAI